MRKLKNRAQETEVVVRQASDSNGVEEGNSGIEDKDAEYFSEADCFNTTLQCCSGPQSTWPQAQQIGFHRWRWRAMRINLNT